MTKKVDEYINIMEDLGVTPHESKILLFLKKEKNASSRVIERGTFLRQPDVSLATNELNKRGWLEVNTVRLEGKGRPFNVYSFAKPFEKIMKEIITKAEKEIEKLENEINILKQLT